MKQKVSISIILTLMLAVIDSWTLLNAEDQSSSTENNEIARVLEVKGKKAYYKKSNMKNWQKLSNNPAEYTKIRFFNNDLVKVEKTSKREKPSSVIIECTVSTIRVIVPPNGRELSPSSKCPPISKPDE